MNHSHTEQRSADTLATTTSAELRVEGMTCNNCARHVTEAIQSVPGVQSVLVNLQSQRASVRWKRDSTTDAGALIATIAAAGYEAKPIERTSQAHRTDWYSNLWLGGIITGVLMLGEWVFPFGKERWFQWIAFVLASVAQVFCGAQFYRG